MEFDSLDDVKNLYTSFAKKEGFGIRTYLFALMLANMLIVMTKKKAIQSQ
jgi:hypothetical protein